MVDVIAEPLFDAPVALLRRGDVVRWQAVLRTTSAALGDFGHHELAHNLWGILNEFAALLDGADE